MVSIYSIKKLFRTLKATGVTTTSQEVVSYLRTQMASTFEGSPGYYALHHRRLANHYSNQDLTPIWVSPTEITQLTGTYDVRDRGHLDYVPFFKPREASWNNLPYSEEIPYRTVVSGIWDQQTTDFSRLLMFQGIKQRFNHGLPWEETIYYEKLYERFQNEGWTNSEADDLSRKRCDSIDVVYNKIKRSGYQSQNTLNGHPLHEVTVNVSRNGELLYNCEGRHRLSIAKILRVEKIPVLILAVHDAYQGSLEEVVQ